MSHVIITYTGVHYPITAEQEINLRSMSMDDELTLSGNIVKVRNIADVLTMAKYYETYPKRRPAQTDRYKEIPGMGLLGVVEHVKDKDYALKGMIKGLKNFINREHPPEGSQSRDILKQMEKKLELAK